MNFQSDCRRVLVKLPSWLSDERYAAITLAIFGVLDAAGIVSSSSIEADEQATDAVLNDGFDRYSENYPWALEPHQPGRHKVLMRSWMTSVVGLGTRRRCR